MRMLVVEDAQGEIDTWQRMVDRHNAEAGEHSFEVVAEYAKAFTAAAELIEARKYDVAVVDLRLSGASDRPGGHNADGNRVVDLLTKSATAAVAIYTGQPAEVANFSGSPQIRTFTKGSGHEPIFDWIRQQRPIIIQMQRATKEIEKDMASVFHSSIWPRWQFWAQGTDDTKLHAALTRHFVSHLYDELTHSTGGEAHSEEWYFVQLPDTRPLSTGDLVIRDGNEVEIVITPRCDFSNTGKSTSVQLAKCKDISPKWDELAAKTGKGAAEDVRKIRQHDRSVVQHFLPRMRMTDGGERGPWFVRFDQISSIVNSEDVLATLRKQRFATLTSEYLPSLVERLGSYFSRIGSPDNS